MSLLHSHPSGPEPLLGEDNAYVYREVLGMSERELAQLQEAKVIY